MVSSAAEWAAYISGVIAVLGFSCKETVMAYTSVLNEQLQG